MTIDVQLRALETNLTVYTVHLRAHVCQSVRGTVELACSGQTNEKQISQRSESTIGKSYQGNCMEKNCHNRDKQGSRETLDLTKDEYTVFTRR